jgi:hypothetical protein
MALGGITAKQKLAQSALVYFQARLITVVWHWSNAWQARCLARLKSGYD